MWWLWTRKYNQIACITYEWEKSRLKETRSNREYQEAIVDALMHAIDVVGFRRRPRMCCRPWNCLNGTVTKNPILTFCKKNSMLFWWFSPSRTSLQSSLRVPHAQLYVYESNRLIILDSILEIDGKNIWFSSHILCFQNWENHAFFNSIKICMLCLLTYNLYLHSLMQNHPKIFLYHLFDLIWILND